MKIIVIDGVISAFGESTLNGSIRQYDYVSFVDENDRETLVRKLRVSQDVDRLIVPGGRGTFIIGKSRLETGLYAAKVDGRDAYVSWLASSSIGPIISYIVLMLFGFILLPLVFIPAIGIFFFAIGAFGVFLGVYGLYVFPSNKKEIIQASHKAGISLQAVERI